MASRETLGALLDATALLAVLLGVVCGALAMIVAIALLGRR